MPVMDGSAALIEIKKSYPNIKVVMLTMNDTKQMVLEMLKLGADGYLTKNDDCEEIYNAIVTCKNEGQYITKKNSDILLKSLRDNPIATNNEYSAPKTMEAIHNVQNQPEVKKFSVKNVLVYTLLTLLITAIVILSLFQLNVNLSSIKNIDPPITYINK